MEKETRCEMRWGRISSAFRIPFPTTSSQPKHGAAAVAHLGGAAIDAGGRVAGDELDAAADGPRGDNFNVVAEIAQLGDGIFADAGIELDGGVERFHLRAVRELRGLNRLLDVK